MLDASSPASLPRFRADSACGVPRMNLDRRDSAAGQFGAPTDPRPQPAIHNSPRDRSERSRGTYKPQGAARKHRHKLMPRNRSKLDEMSRQVTVSNGFIAESSVRKPRRHSRPRRTPIGRHEKMINFIRTKGVTHPPPPPGQPRRAIADQLDNSMSTQQSASLKVIIRLRSEHLCPVLWHQLVTTLPIHAPGSVSSPWSFGASTGAVVDCCLKSSARWCARPDASRQHD